MTSIDSYFQIRQRGSTIGREVRGGIATFLTMAYILFVNPQILSNAGMDFNATLACTALAAGICCLLMGFISNFPLATASGMGINAIVAFGIVKGMHGTWQTAMGLIVIDGVVMLLLVLAGLREAILRSIPRDLRLAIGAGIGLFIAFIGLTNAGIVKQGDGTPMMVGDLHSHATLLAMGGTLLIAFLISRKIPGAVLIGILATTAVAFPLGLTHWPDHFAMPTFAASALHPDFKSALSLTWLPMLFSLLMIDFFDTIGTATAIAEQAKLVDRDGNIPAVKNILLVDSLAASIGGLLGASSVTAYIESAAGVAEGSRTGFHSIVVGVLFFAAIFLAPVAGIVPAAATAPALIMVGFLMMTQVKQIDFEKLDTAIPAFVTLITIPLSYSIAHGIGYGFITYVVIKLLGFRWTQVHPLMYLVAVAFGFFFYYSR